MFAIYNTSLYVMNFSTALYIIIWTWKCKQLILHHLIWTIFYTFSDIYYSKGAQTGIFASLSSGSSEVHCLSYLSTRDKSKLSIQKPLFTVVLFTMDNCIAGYMLDSRFYFQRQEKDKNLERATRYLTSPYQTYAQGQFYKKAKFVYSVTY